MSIAHVSSKGQITLPAGMRKKLGINANDRVEIESSEKAIIIRPVLDFLALKGFLGKALPRAEEQMKMKKAVAAHVGRRKR